jgi:hypothetical protein
MGIKFHFNRNTIKKYLLSLIALTLVITLSACNSGSGSIQNTANTSPSPSTNSRDTTVAPTPAPPKPAPAPQTPQIPSGAISWSDAGQHIGETATIYGQVMSVKFASGSNGQPTFINLGADYPKSNRVQVLIWGQNRGNFSSTPESMYRGKTICVSGYIDTYNGVVQIEVTSPNQIEIIS